MADLIVVTFPGTDTAAEVMRDLRKVERDGYIKFHDTEILACDADGKVHKKSELDSGTETGMVAGGILGVMLSFLFPVVGLVAGVALGGIVGRMFGLNVDSKFVKEVRESMKPNTSALFLLIRSGEPSAIRAALKGREGSVLQTTISDELAGELEHAMRQQNPPTASAQ